MKKLPQVLTQVDWMDAHTSHGWEERSEIDDKPAVVTTVGFLVKKSSKAVVIASTISEGSNNARIVIPAGMIVGMKEAVLRYLPAESKNPSPPEPPTVQSPE